MKNSLAKISLIILIVTIIVSCNTTKRVPDTKRLLMKNEVSVDGKSEKDEEVINQLYQKPNSSILGYRLRLNIYNWAKKDTTDSIARCQ